MKKYLKYCYATFLVLVTIGGFIWVKTTLPDSLSFSNIYEENRLQNILAKNNLQIKDIEINTTNNQQIITFTNNMVLITPRTMPSNDWLYILLSIAKQTKIDNIAAINLAANHPYATAKNN